MSMTQVHLFQKSVVDEIILILSKPRRSTVYCNAICRA